MRFWFTVGIFLITSQVFLQTACGKVLNPDDNRTSNEYDTTKHEGALTPEPEIVHDATVGNTDRVSFKDDPMKELGAVIAQENVNKMSAAPSYEIMSTGRVVHVSEVASPPQDTLKEVSELSQVPTRTKDPEVVTEQATSIANDNDTETDTDKPSQSFVFPDPIEKYSNTIMLTGHVFGVHNDVISMIHSSLSSGSIFVPVDPLRVDLVSSSFEEMGYEGDKVTHIRYVVSYNGRPIHTETITKIMHYPKISHHFKHQLDGHSLRQYKEAKPIMEETWIHLHLAAVVATSCVAFALIILVISIIVAKKRSSAASKLEKKKPFSSHGSSEKKSPPPPYSIDNPAYSFETNAVMDGVTLP